MVLFSYQSRVNWSEKSAQSLNSWWWNPMNILSALLAFCGPLCGESTEQADSPHKEPVMQCFDDHFVLGLTHLPLDKMATVLADDSFRCILLNENDRILMRISLKFVPRSSIDNKPALVQVMAWRRTGDKPLPEPMRIQFTDAYMRY